MSLHGRLLHDYAELQKSPYTNIALIPHENDIRRACLILGANNRDPLHLTVRFRDDYPLRAPSIEINSSIEHSNIFGSYICASILNTNDGWTPAYTIKGIAIQLLSFFSSENLEQEFGGVVNLDIDRLPDGCWVASGNQYDCAVCQYHRPNAAYQMSQRSTWTTWSKNMRRKFNFPTAGDDSAQAPVMSLPNVNSHRDFPALNGSSDAQEADPSEIPDLVAEDMEVVPGPIESLPEELLVALCDQMDDETLMTFARSWGRVGSKFGVVAQFSLLRKRDLRCFVLKKSFKEAQLGVGVAITFRGRSGALSSEFDLLSSTAFKEHRVRRSVMGLHFGHFLPLPISRRHYQSVREEIVPSLIEIGVAARLPSNSPSDIIISFMNDVVVQLCDQTKHMNKASALGRASERAIESYFHLFHLLLCLATSNSDIVRAINRTVACILEQNPRTDKNTIPNLGHFLIAMLLSDIDTDGKVVQTLITEAITRNVVWMLNGQKGKGMYELAYLEGDPVSKYRLKKTFEASKTSYTLLMFQNLFRRAINRGTGANRKSLAQMRDELFDAHGAPPKGTAEALAQRIRQLQTVDNFSDFIDNMGVSKPSEQFLTSLLRGCVFNSVKRGYSRWGVSQGTAYRRRRELDPSVTFRTEWPEGTTRPDGSHTLTSFFPNLPRRGGGGGGNDRGGSRDRGRGRRYGRGRG